MNKVRSLIMICSIMILKHTEVEITAKVIAWVFWKLQMKLVLLIDSVWKVLMNN